MINTCALDLIPLFLYHGNSFPSVYQYALESTITKANKAKSCDSIIISGYHLTSQLPSKIPQELHKLVSPLSHLSFSQPTPVGLLHTLCVSNSAFVNSVNELEVVNSMVNSSYLV